MRAIPGAVKDALSDARYGRDLMHRCKMDTPGWAHCSFSGGVQP